MHNCKCSYLLCNFILLFSEILLLIEFCFIISRRTFKNTCAAYYGIHSLQLIPNARDYCVKFYQIIWKYTDKKLLSTQNSPPTASFGQKIFILLRVYGWKLRECRFCRGLIKFIKLQSKSASPISINYFFEKKLSFIWLFNEKNVPLHTQFGSISSL